MSTPLSSLLIVLLARASAQSLTWCKISRAGSCHGNAQTLTAVEAASTGLPQHLTGKTELTFVDWDKDGLPDVLARNSAGALEFHRRFSDHSFQTSILEGVSLPRLNSESQEWEPECKDPEYSLHAVDWDADGDVDLVVTAWSICDRQAFHIRYFERVLIHGTGSLLERPVAETALSQVSKLTTYSVFQAVDWDSDGDLDVMIWDSNEDVLRFFERISKDQLQERQGPLNPFHGLAFVYGSGSRYFPVLAVHAVDWDQDGDVDLIVVFRTFGLHLDCAAKDNYVVKYVEQLADGTLVDRGVLHTPFYGIYRGSRWCPLTPIHALDWNGDGWLELWASTTYFQQSRSNAAVRRYGPDSPFALLGNLRGVPMMVDWDGDGDVDLLLSSTVEGRTVLRFFERSSQSGLKEHLPGTDLGQADPEVPCRFTAIDWDGDGDLDLVVGAPDGKLKYFNRSGDTLLEAPEQENPFRGIVNSKSQNSKGYVRPAVLDLDGDGDLDLLLSGDGFRFFQQVEGHLRDVVNLSVTLTWNKQPALQPVNVSNVSKLNVANIFNDLGVTCELRSPLMVECSTLDVLVETSTDTDEEPSQGLEFERYVADWDADGDFDLLEISDNGYIHYYSTGFCQSSAPCSNSGLCTSPSGTCECTAGHDLVDCSACSAGHYTQHKIAGEPRQCFPCAGKTRHQLACAGRGVCYDDVAARSAYVNTSAKLLAGVVGNGSCSCSELFFNGTGDAGRTTCAEGVCPAGSEEVDGNADPGRAHRGRHCRPCPSGTFSEEGGQCHRCPSGQASKAGSERCQDCPSPWLNFVAHSSNEYCEWDPLSLVFAAVFFLSSLGTIVLVSKLCRHTVLVANVSLQNGRLVLTTHGPHRILRSATVKLSGTGVPAMDGDSYHSQAVPAFRAEVQGREQLILHHPDGLAGRWDTSMGQLRVDFPRTLVSVGFFRLPVGAWLPALAAVAAGSLAIKITAGSSAMNVPVRLVGVEVAAAVFAVVVHRLYLRWVHTAPLAESLMQFQHQLRAKLPRLVVCDRGPQRAITAGQLFELAEFFHAYLMDRSMYYVCSNLVKPLTRLHRLSYAEVVGPSEVKWFVSHYWGTSFLDFCQAVKRHALLAQSSWQRQAYWICTFSNNQWEVETEVGNGDWRSSSFYLALQSPTCGGTVLVMDEAALPLQRAWCLFEVFQTQQLANRRPDFAGLIFSTHSGVLGQGGGSVDTSLAMAERLATLDLRFAEASDERDLAMIRDLVASEPGGFDAVNGFVRGAIGEALLAVRSRFEHDSTRLLHSLSQGSTCSLTCRSAAVTPTNRAPVQTGSDTDHANDALNSPMSWQRSPDIDLEMSRRPQGD